MATTIPTNMVNIAGINQPSGFTVATPNPLYVWGNYNCPNAAYLNTTNTTTCLPGFAGVRRPDHPLGELGGQRTAPRLWAQRG